MGRDSRTNVSAAWLEAIKAISVDIFDHILNMVVQGR